MNLERLARRTTGGRYIAEVDGLRFLAIAMVLLVHLQGALSVARGAPLLRPFGPILIPGAPRALVYAGPTNLLSRVMYQGRFGVELFFILSGFILGLPLVRTHADRDALKRFYMRRVTRLEPPYLVALLISALIGTTLVPHGFPIKDFAQTAAYLSAPLKGFSLVNVTFWSLSVEIQFYLLLPLLAWIFYRKQARSRLVFGAVAATIFHLEFIHSLGATATVAGYLQFFIVGMLIADVYVRSPHQHRAWDAAGLVSVLAVFAWPFVSLNLTLFDEFVMP